MSFLWSKSNNSVWENQCGLLGGKKSHMLHESCLQQGLWAAGRSSIPVIRSSWCAAWWMRSHHPTSLQKFLPPSLTWYMLEEGFLGFWFLIWGNRCGCCKKRISCVWSLNGLPLESIPWFFVSGNGKKGYITICGIWGPGRVYGAWWETITNRYPNTRAAGRKGACFPLAVSLLISYVCVRCLAVILPNIPFPSNCMK